MAMLADHTNQPPPRGAAPGGAQANGAAAVRVITDADIAKMSVAELDDLIAKLREQQERDAPHRKMLEALRKNRIKRFEFFSSYGDYEDRTPEFLREHLLPKEGEDPHFHDWKNLCGDMDRVGRDLWIAHLRYLRSVKAANGK